MLRRAEVKHSGFLLWLCVLAQTYQIKDIGGKLSGSYDLRNSYLSSYCTVALVANQVARPPFAAPQGRGWTGMMGSTNRPTNPENEQNGILPITIRL